ncbi:hypothetical protein CSQ85_01425 [Bifidobacterium rousetti]|uniref:hypothetical protein n=1 Tax=Bifidobacterium rousetti TaxID=2045439 RepID=UPI0012389665|nr:hypothetical protein [Bifidobacterium rousetti]KAA8820475.1 hypothetical protein CSQ85_01425 [Bifidobacterium rousetti]
MSAYMPEQHRRNIRRIGDLIDDVTGLLDEYRRLDPNILTFADTINELVDARISLTNTIRAIRQEVEAQAIEQARRLEPEPVTLEIPIISIPDHDHKDQA